MALMWVEAIGESAAERAAVLARELGVPVGRPGVVRANASAASAATVATATSPEAGVKLIFDPAGIALGFVDKKRGKPYYVDFLSATWKARFQSPLGRNHIFRRALGVRDAPLMVVDATAGFGQDAVLALSLGCQVTALERSPAVAALLRDGVERAVREDEILRSKFTNMQIVQADAIEYLKTAAPPDVVYLDPMFDKPKKTAKSPKEMQLLQELLTHTAPGEDLRLFEAAWAAARQRVVVKCPLKSRALKTPSHSFKGQSIRYDVYVKS